MNPSKGLLRFFQINFVVAVFLVRFLLIRIPYRPTLGLTTVSQWLVVVLAIYFAACGLMSGRMFRSDRAMTPQAIQKFPPLRRWFIRHLLWLGSGELVCMCALVFRAISGPAWLFYLLLGLGLAMLLLWRPDTPPQPDAPS